MAQRSYGLYSSGLTAFVCRVLAPKLRCPASSISVSSCASVSDRTYAVSLAFGGHNYTGYALYRPLTIQAITYTGDDYTGRSYTGRNYTGHDYTSNNYTSHNYTGHNYTGHNHTGHHYTGHT